VRREHFICAATRHEPRDLDHCRAVKETDVSNPFVTCSDSLEALMSTIKDVSGTVF
jgi:hypothetical protein